MSFIAYIFVYLVFFFFLPQNNFSCIITIPFAQELGGYFHIVIANELFAGERHNVSFIQGNTK